MSTAVADDFQMNAWKPGINPWLITVAVMLATFMVVLDSSIANVALPQMAGSFSHSQDESMWILTIYLIANGIVIPTCAWFSNLLGRKTFFMSCIILFTLASALCGMSTSLGMMIFARILQGLGGGALMPISQAILFESFPKEKRGLAMSVFGLGIVLGPIVGPPLGGWITDAYSWNWIFFINIPFGILAALFTNMFITDPPYAQKTGVQKIDYLGFSSLIIWLVTLQIVLDKGNNADWFGSSWVCWTFAVSAISMIFFFIRQLVYTNPIIDLKVFKDRNFAIGTVLFTFVNGILYASIAILPLFLQNLLGYNAFLSGYAIMPRGIGVIAALIITGTLSGKIDDRILIAAGIFFTGLSSFMLGDINLVISMNSIIGPNLVCGLGLGLSMIPLTTISMATLRNEQLTNANGIQNLMKNIGGAVGTSLVVTLISRYSQTHQYAMVGHLSQLNPVFQNKLAAAQQFLSTYMSPFVAAYKANYLMYASFLNLSALWAYVDAFRFFGIICIILLPFIFMLKRVKTKGSGMTAMH
jgi:MFS transporter, DHA2 family, multidrug resistance protein